jgi:hypothetical protein
MRLAGGQKLFVIGGLALVFAGGTAGVWEVFAQQAPFTPFRAPHLPGPISQLRESAVVLGLLFFAAAWLLPHAVAPDARAARVIAWVAIAGAALVIGTLVAGAVRGMVVFQIFDPRPVAVRLFVFRAMGSLLLGGAYVELARRLLRALLVSDHPGDLEKAPSELRQTDLGETVDVHEAARRAGDRAGA